MKYLQRSPARRPAKTVFTLAAVLPTDTRGASNSLWGVSQSDAAPPPTREDVSRPCKGSRCANGRTKALRRLILVLAVWLFGYSATVVSAQTIQYLSTVYTNNSPCNPGRCLLSRWKATVPLSQTLTYTVELSTNCLSWEEATTPITLTQSTNIDVWITADTLVGFVRLRIVQ
jgi:hypothetical protein